MHQQFSERTNIKPVWYKKGEFVSIEQAVEKIIKDYNKSAQNPDMGWTKIHEAKTDKKVGEFSFEDKKYDIIQDSNDSSGFGIKDKSGNWDVMAMGDEFNPESFDMNLKKMNKWIDDGIKYFSEMKSVSAKVISNSEWSDFFQNELDEQVPMNKFYVLAKFACGKENAKSNL